MKPKTDSRQTETRLEVMDRLLVPFHGQFGSLVDLHRQMMERDPFFYGRLATWNLTRGLARPESFVATLLTAAPEHREAGSALLQELAPDQVSRVIKILKRHVGKTPRSTRGAVIHYLRRLEEAPELFDQAVSTARRSMKHLYASLHIRPSDRADRILFKNELPVELGPANYDRVGGNNDLGRLNGEGPCRIRRPTALLVDKSAGMESALELGEKVAMAMSQRIEAPFQVYAFDMVPYLVEPATLDEVGWRDAFRHLRAAGSRSPGSVLETLRRKRFAVEQLVLVTGGDETSRPAFVDTYGDYASQINAHPEVFVVGTDEPAFDFIERLEIHNIQVSSLTSPEGPSFCLDEALHRWSQPSRRDLLDEILAVPLPTKRAA